ncbi:hypothetical protein G9F31_01020 [Acinetobacter sp. 187]|uniref:hypothetical protein n=1 Tax=Acinetobacter lanii TaxID=2715163 RepID=UPI00140A1100|nr:hypothetical protein [Acinetobacter lanii]NHC02366.1 hypothetical protein [Acinetobacter lanii]
MTIQVGRHIKSIRTGQIYQVREIKTSKGELMYRVGKTCWIWAKDFKKLGGK